MNHNMRCPQCMAYGGEHGPECALQTIDYRARQAERYYQAWLKKETEHKDLRSRLTKEITFWRGKFQAVKQENNALRKNLKVS